MITPRFSLSQDALTLTINIRAPYSNLSELDVNVEENRFIFVCSPYYLRLNLPGNILDNENRKSAFDSDTGLFTFTYEKETANEEFPNLDFITTLLQPKTVDVFECGRKIEVLTSESASDVSDPSSAKYGFALRGGYNFKSVNCEFNDIFKIDPFDVEFAERTALRLSIEQGKFDPGHYVADLIEDEEIKEIIKVNCPWENLVEESIMFCDKELDFMKDLPNIDYNLSTEQVNYCLNSLLEMLFAYCYDRRTTFYEGTCESDWTISNISASLCCFDSFSDPKSAVICAYRRSLIYPLYRSFSLCEKVFEDLKCLLKLGPKYVIRCLINVHEIFLNRSSGRYILNKLFIDDYVVYMMKCDLNGWKKLVETLMKVKIGKGELGLGLNEIENSISDNELAGALAELKVLDDDEDSDDTITEDSESDSSCSESTNTDKVNGP